MRGLAVASRIGFAQRLIDERIREHRRTREVRRAIGDQHAVGIGRAQIGKRARQLRRRQYQRAPACERRQRDDDEGVEVVAEVRDIAPPAEAPARARAQRATRRPRSAARRDARRRRSRCVALDERTHAVTGMRQRAASERSRSARARAATRERSADSASAGTAIRRRTTAATATKLPTATNHVQATGDA